MANFTKQAIKSSFIKLLNEKPFNKISVRDIVEDCGINRNSFYYHFQDIPTLVEEIILEETEYLIDKYPTMDSLDVFVDEIYQLCMKNKKALLHLFNSANRNLYEESAMRICKEIVTKYVDTAFHDVPMTQKEKRLYIDANKCMLFGFCIDWISNGLKAEYLEDLHSVCELTRKFFDNIKE